MLIRVIYTDGNFDMVKPQLLNRLLASYKVARFKRTTGWAVVGRDAIRTRRLHAYCGEERRVN